MFIQKKKSHNGGVVMKNIEILIDQVIDRNLGLRLSATDLFDELNNTPEKNIIINFHNVEFISRSFAHEYVKQKMKTNKNIIEKDVPEDVGQMLTIVKSTPV